MKVQDTGDARASRSRRRRVLLRPPTSADQREFLALARASRKLHRPWVYPPETAAAFRSYLRWSRAKTFRGLLAVRREDGAIVGAFKLSQIFHGDFRNAYLGYWVGAPFAGQGYMTEAMALLLSHAFRTLKLHRVEANVQPGNRRSAELLQPHRFPEGGVLTPLPQGGRPLA